VTKTFTVDTSGSVSGGDFVWTGSAVEEAEVFELGGEVYAGDRDSFGDMERSYVRDTTRTTVSDPGGFGTYLADYTDVRLDTTVIEVTEFGSEAESAYDQTETRIEEYTSSRRARSTPARTRSAGRAPSRRWSTASARTRPAWR
jgi:hypothetical protein